MPLRHIAEEAGLKTSRQARSMGRYVGLLRATQVFVGPGLVVFFLFCFVSFFQENVEIWILK